ncbi:MAG: zinc ribbon domain-containing protein [Gammaproteobacteria bacterium]|nr:zinc ribbon domain-containing protein [Gammaproteobacteria bacterium]
MPIYEYVCEACEQTHDALQKMSDAPLTDCPNCGESALSKKLSAPGFRLSGSGWYETDFKSGNKRNVADKSDSASGSASSGHSCASGGCSACN